MGILLVEGVDGERVVANRKAEELFGHQLPPEGGIAQYVGQVYLPDGTSRARTALAITRALQGETVIGELVRDVVSRMTRANPEHVIRLEVQRGIPATCVDPGRIEWVLSNLLSNAAKYSFPQTEIRVAVERHEGDVMISVTNRGAGIPPEEIPKLFSRFYRAKAAQTGPVGGLGLGLYISKGLVEAHRGRMWVESVPEKTTTFHFTLPLDTSDCA